MSLVRVVEVHCIVEVTHDFDRYVVVVTSHGVLPRFGFTCIGFLAVYEAVKNCFVHVLEFLELIRSALFIPSIHAFALSGPGIYLAHLPDLMVSTVVA
jgi:hypothetical protein